MTVGERIKQRRIELNLSQDELAKKVGYKSRSSIQKIECARDLPLNKVERMANALETTPAYLMGWEDDPISYDPDKVEKAIKLYEQFSSLTPEYQTVLLDMIEAAQIAADLHQAKKDSNQ